MERSKTKGISAAVCTLAVALCVAAQAATVYVDDDAVGANDGSSWTDAFTYLQDALSVAQDGDEIRVAQGVYRPDRSSAYPDGTGDRMVSFHLLDGVAIMGGYAGTGAPDPNVRDIARYETVLCGDLAENDIPVTDPRDLLTEPTRAENSYHIVTAEVCGRSAVLDGFTIRAGTDGALYLPDTTALCSPSIRNCTFVGNSANGGAAVRVFSARPELIDCTLLCNVALQGGAVSVVLGRGGPQAGEFVIRGCTFAWNFAAGVGEFAAGEGGAIAIRSGSPSVIGNCTFIGNAAEIGGAIYSDCRENIVNCLFVQNVAAEAGGATYFEGTEMNVTSCTFSDNLAPYARACYAGGQAVLSITNTILWNGGDEIGIGEDSLVQVAYSNVLGGWPGEGNVDADPLFAAPGYWDPNSTPDDPNDDFWVDGDYHLKSQAGHWDPNSQSWVIDEVTSPCIDAGDPNSPIGLEPFPNGGYVNMGAYGGTAEAGKSYFGGPPCETIMAGDINGDCKVDFADLAILVEHWTEPALADMSVPTSRGR